MLRGDILALYILLYILLSIPLKTSDARSSNKYPATKITEADYAGDLALLSD